MATRLYLSSAAAGISPAVAAGWDVSNLLVRAAASTSSADHDGSKDGVTFSGSGVANDDTACFQLVYGPLASQTLTGTVKGYLGWREASTNTDARAQMTIRTIASDGSTVRGTNYALSTSALSSEFNVDTNVRQSRRFPLNGDSNSLTSVDIQAGDYLVIEVGFRNHGTNTSAVRGGFGSASVASGDVPENQTTTTNDLYRGWIEFSQTLIPYTAASASATTAIAVTANNAKTTIKPTAGNASISISANNATVSNLAPPRLITIDSVDYAEKIRWDSFSFVECANRGQVGIGGADVDDATNSLTIPALKRVVFDEPAAGQSNKRVFTGYTHDRTTERGPSKVAGQRQWGVEFLDLNTIADDYILTDAESADRPAETDYARVVWLLTTRFNTVAGVASGVVPNSNTANMDAVDYRGRRARDVLNECAEMSGKNWFIYQYLATGGPLLFYDVTSGSNLSSSSKISDVLSDVDNSTTWAASNVKVHKSPDDIYSTVYVRWNEGIVSATNATTASTYRTREIMVTDLSIDSSTKATAKANAFLTAAASEKIRVDEISIVLPAANVNDFRAGQRCEIKLDRHGLSSFTYYRILQRKVEPVNDVSYKVTLTLADQVLPNLFSGGGRGHELPYGVWEKYSNVNDDAATVVIDRGGITVTDGAITVTNSGAIVIIDGSSNMFKIAAEGTQSVTIANHLTGASSTTLSSLGALAACPASLLIHSNTNASTGLQSPGIFYSSSYEAFASATSGGATNLGIGAMSDFVTGYVTLNGSSQAVVVIQGVNSSGSSMTRYQKYFVLQETAF